jgi:tripartite-type tricarboxylate transporter receptor subunit TctC
VRVVIPYAPGGSSDAIARILGQQLSAKHKQQFVIDNRPGAAGSLGREIVARAAPDGYTLLIGDAPHTINVHVLRHVPYDPIRDFTAITLLASAPQALVINPGLPMQNLREFVAAVSAAPGKYNYGSGGNGSITQLAAELFKQSARLSITHVPYKSVGIATADVLAGQMHMAFPTLPGVVTHVRGGRLRALGISSLKRSAALPEVPTFEEGGVANVIVANWFGLFTPARLPAGLLATLHGITLDALNAPDVRAKLGNLSLDIITQTPQAFDAFLKQELEKWGKVVKAAGIRAE